MRTPEELRALIEGANKEQLALLLSTILVRLLSEPGAPGPDRPLNLGETAQVLRISRDTLSQIIARGEIQTVQIGGRTKVMTSAITAYLHRGSNGVPQIPSTLLGRRLARRSKGSS